MFFKETGDTPVVTGRFFFKETGDTPVVTGRFFFKETGATPVVTGRFFLKGKLEKGLPDHASSALPTNHFLIVDSLFESPPPT
jgi:hypothetical protein